MTSTRRGSYKLPLRAQLRPAPGLPKLLICLTLALLLLVSGLATISGSSWAGVGVSPALISQDGYIWENDDGTSPDSNSAQAAAKTAITGVHKGERLTARIQLTNTGNTLTDDHKLGLFYDRGDGYWTRVRNQNPTSNSAGTCGANSTSIAESLSQMAAQPCTRRSPSTPQASRRLHSRTQPMEIS